MSATVRSTPRRKAARSTERSLPTRRPMSPAEQRAALAKFNSMKESR